MNSVNFNTDKNIIVYYPGGSGGKFLVNCLSLGTNAEMLDSGLIGAEPDTKFDTIMSRLEKVTVAWNDLNMSGTDFAYGNVFSVQTTNRSIVDLMIKSVSVTPELVNSIAWPQHIIELSQGNNYFFTTVHSIDELYVVSHIWPSATIINFANFGRFLNQYRPWRIDQNTELQNFNSIFRIVRKLKRQWQQLCGASWPAMPLSVAELENLPTAIENELKQMAPKFLINLRKGVVLIDFYKSLSTGKQVLNWNTEYYLDSSGISRNVHKIAKQLGINLNHEKQVDQYFANWIQVLQKIKNESVAYVNVKDISTVDLKKKIETVLTQMQKFPQYQDTKAQTALVKELEKIQQEITLRQNSV